MLYSKGGDIKQTNSYPEVVKEAMDVNVYDENLKMKKVFKLGFILLTLG